MLCIKKTMPNKTPYHIAALGCIFALFAGVCNLCVGSHNPPFLSAPTRRGKGRLVIFIRVKKPIVRFGKVGSFANNFNLMFCCATAKAALRLIGKLTRSTLNRRKLCPFRTAIFQPNGGLIRVISCFHNSTSLSGQAQRRALPIRFTYLTPHNNYYIFAFASRAFFPSAVSP